MALALENPSPNKVRRVAQFASAKGISAEKAWNHAGFAKAVPVSSRGNKNASSAWRQFWNPGPKGSGGRWGRPGKRGGATTGKSRQAAWDVYYKMHNKGKSISYAQKRKAAVIKSGDGPALKRLAMNKLKQAARAKTSDGKLPKNFSKSAAYKRVASFSVEQARSAAGVTGKKLLTSSAKYKARKAGQKQRMDKMRASGVMNMMPPGRSKAKAKSKAKSGKSRSVKADKWSKTGGTRDSINAKARKIMKAEGLSWPQSVSKAASFYNKGNWEAKGNPYGALALENGYGALALENPMSIGTIAKGTVGSMAAAAITYSVIDFGEQYLGEYYGAVPLVGGLLEAAPATTTAVLISGALAITGAGAYAMDRIPGGTASAVVGTAVGVMVLGGAIMDMDRAGGAMAWGESLWAGLTGGVSDAGEDFDEMGDFGEEEYDDMGALALENGYGALALENGYGDGMAYELQSLAGTSDDFVDYSQASLGDAYYSGADFDMGEGQALLNGRSAWRKRFGRPARRQSRKANACSHLAGKRGHRWGWMVKLIGWERTCALASLTPKRRVKAVKKVRAAAVAAFRDIKARAQAEGVTGADVRRRVVQAATTPAPMASEFGLPSTLLASTPAFLAPATGYSVTPAAGAVSTPAMGPAGPSGASGDLGAFLFTS